MVILILLTIAFASVANSTESPQTDVPHRPHHLKRDSETKYNPETATMSPLQLQQIITAAKVTFESLSKSTKSEDKPENEAEFDEIEELWACTEISLKLETCYLISSFDISLKPMNCHDLNLKISAMVEGRKQDLFITQKSRMVAKSQEKTATCTQRLKR
jgi:hypothetical protein